MVELPSILKTDERGVGEVSCWADFHSSVIDRRTESNGLSRIQVSEAVSFLVFKLKRKKNKKLKI